PRRLPGAALRTSRSARAGERGLPAEPRRARAGRAHSGGVRASRSARRGGHRGRRPDGGLSGGVPCAGAAAGDAGGGGQGPGARRLSVALPLAATLAIQTLLSFTMYCAPVMAPAAAPELGISPAAIGYFVTFAFLGAAFGTMTGGGWVGRFGPIRVSQAGLVICGLGIVV